MKKILLPLLLIAASMGITKLRAYCFYNYSKDKTITIHVYKSHAGEVLSMGSAIVAKYTLKPNGGKGCWNWKDIDKKNRKKEWYWVAFRGKGAKHLFWSKRIVRGSFPIGGAVYFSGWTTPKGEFDIYYDGKPWKWWEKPWNHTKKPWEKK